MKFIKTKVKNIITTINKITNLEYAVFDTNSKLVTATQDYLKIKGSTVHTESIENVLIQGNVIVNKPGYMPSCKGCRFVTNCPSKIEILCNIKSDDKLIGILSLTSFTERGHEKINNNIESYINLLKNISDILVMFFMEQNIQKQNDSVSKIIEVLLDQSNENYIVINKEGNILYIDPIFEKKFLSYCNLYTKSISQIFPENILHWINSKTKYAQKKFDIRDTSYRLHLQPIDAGKEILGYVLRLKKINNSSLMENKNNYLDSIVSQDRRIKLLKNKVKKITNSPSAVLITGKTGTGKEMFAKAIHNIGDKSNKPFVPINCSNIPESLFESEMFGYEEGAFTGARKNGKIGLFEMANGGSLFLDEIGELPLNFQAKLLRVLQEKTITRVGGVDEIPINVRLISATNKNLEEMIKNNKFRDDLFYRINVIPLNLPTLKERSNDIELLANYFIKKHSEILNKKIHSISDDSLKILKNYSWPGNIRELENAIEYAINMEETTIIHKNNLPGRIKTALPKETNETLDIENQILEKEIQIITNKLNENGWTVKGKEKTAKDLGISLRTLYRKIEKENVLQG